MPSIDLIVAGDVVNNDIHPYLAETTTHTRLEWMDGTDKLEALAPLAVVAGHKIPDHDDSPRHIAETRQYLRDFNRLDQTTDTPRELFDAMIKLYPDRANPGSLWGGANAAKAAAANTDPQTVPEPRHALLASGESLKRRAEPSMRTRAVPLRRTEQRRRGSSDCAMGDEEHSR